jgi:entericidin B
MGRIVTIALVLSGLAVASCNTVAGAGKDVSSVGKATTKAADKAK